MSNATVNPPMLSAGNSGLIFADIVVVAAAVVVSGDAGTCAAGRGGSVGSWSGVVVVGGIVVVVGLGFAVVGGGAVVAGGAVVSGAGAAVVGGGAAVVGTAVVGTVGGGSWPADVPANSQLRQPTANETANSDGSNPGRRTTISLPPDPF